MFPERQVRLFMSGGNQAVRIPRGFELPGESVVVRKEGHRVIIEAARPQSLLAVLATLTPVDDDLPAIADPPAPLVGL